MGRVLLLNASYEPLRLISLKRAVLLVVQEKAEILEESDRLIRSASTAMPAPRVIRLRYYVKIPFRATIPLNNRAVLTRDKYECAYCEKRKATTVDHIVPRSRGGRHEWENVVAACRRCNEKKDDKLLSQLGWELRFRPYMPTGVFWLILGVQEIDPAWQPYLAA